MTRVALAVERLSREAFAPYGDVISTQGCTPLVINQGTAERYDDLACLDLCAGSGRPLVSLFRARPAALPLRLRVMERHPIASQAFVPLSGVPFLVVVAPAGGPPAPEQLRAFVTSSREGVNLRRGVWHHPLIALERVCDFLVLDRGDEGNYDEHSFAEHDIVIASAEPSRE